MKYNKKVMKATARVLLFVFTYQLVLPTISFALTTGPSQPEVHGFEPVGTTDMVDMFSGDFVYNIPLLDVEGYPINISYHGGVTMEQEASWVGLGWNINPGVINRTVRGVPDDFNGDTLSKELHIKDENTLRVGLDLGVEVAGLGDPLLGLSADIGTNVNISNYRGVSCDFGLGCGINLARSASVGINMGVGSQTGASIDYNANYSMETSTLMGKDMSATVGIGVGQGYNTRTGLTDKTFSISASAGNQYNSSHINVSGTALPVSIKNYVPCITNSSTMSSIYGRLKLGGELFWVYLYGNIKGSYSNLHYNNDGSRESYGYLYLQNAGGDNSAILDFTRDRDGMFNKTMEYLPPASMTYDIYNVSGQGTGGMFRPFRNDFGSVYDPAISSNQTSNSLALEVGVGDIFEAGIDYTSSGTDITSGPWLKYQKGFTGRTSGSIYEDVYFKQAGELTSVNPDYYAAIGGTAAITPDQASGLPATKPGSGTTRDPRGNLLYCNAGDGGHISEMIQVQKDGKRYCYSLPALNHVQKEATFSVNPPSSTDLAAGLVAYTVGSDDSLSNNKGIDQYYSSTTTPEYAHSFLLTSVLSADYVDVTGDGPTDDDLGSFTKFNYSRKESDYRWKAPFVAGKAQYEPGFWSEPRDDKGSYVAGSRDEWILSTIETKNFISEFYTSKRNDGLGSTEPISHSAPYDTVQTTAASSYELDSIKLYNKHDRFINGDNAVPIKTVFFVYDYSLCTGVPNTTSSGSGKLTLKKIYFRYGNSQKSMLSPYQFGYGYNPAYDASQKDRWGGFKPNNASVTNYEYPFVDQNDTAYNTYAAAWSLNSISLPSGGVIQANYESDDYAYVQDQPAMEMFMIQGLGNGPDYNNGHQLYHDKNSPYLYAYFTRRTSGEIPSLSFKENYFNNQPCMYYNFNVKLTGSNKTYEQIKGYATVTDVGPCSDSVHGYIKFQAVTPTGGGANLHPATYTALNYGRYNLPQILFPGSDPNESDFLNVLAGLKESFEELVSMTRSPIIHLVKISDARDINLNKSFVRLQSVGLRKKGGGQRVKSLLFFDSWNTLAGGNELNATYGKKYDYTINDPTYGVISSGVASYEPLIGGDENPLRMPIQYTAQAGSTWPPNDPIDLYQETPIGESLYPQASVGYSKITVSSINSNVGKSSQGIDVYQFYTAKDFPVIVNNTTLVPITPYHFDLFSQSNQFIGTQGYSLVFNDMHGKPKSIEHSVYNPLSGTTTPINYQIYNYNQSGGQLNNNVLCFVPDATAGLTVTEQQLGVESDVTIDCRQKKEYTHNFTINTNLNVSAIGFAVIPIPLAFPWYGEYTNEFQSATVTKVTQQYGILSNIVSYNEGATTTLTNEIFDAQTGNVVLTSVNNEFQDKEYTYNIPAYFCYIGMAPAYNNVNYEFDIPIMPIDSNNFGEFLMDGQANLNVGDECIVNYAMEGLNYTTTVWYMGSKQFGSSNFSTWGGDSIVDYNHLDSIVYIPPDTLTNVICPDDHCCVGYLLPRFPFNSEPWYYTNTIYNAHVKIVRSGCKNILNQDIETVTETGAVINLKARTYCDSNTRIVPNYLINPDTINPYAIGERGIYRLLGEYAYVTPRDYSSETSRNAGLFWITADLFNGTLYDWHSCQKFPYNYMAFSDITSDSNWHLVRTITKWSPDGKEVENRDAIGNYSTAVYGYNEGLPVAVASNARQGDVLADGFEDYNLLVPKNNLVKNIYSPFYHYFDTTSFSISGYNLLQLTNSSTPSIIQTKAHTGSSSLLTPNTYSGAYSDAYEVPLPINFNPSYTNNHYNFYYPYGAYALTSANEYLPFQLTPGKKYIVSYWAKEFDYEANLLGYSLGSHCGVLIGGSGGTFYPMVKKTNIIDGWQQVEVTFGLSATDSVAALEFPMKYCIDDLRIFPADANMKSFVYNPVNEKLMATLDENNFATLYEYDQEGNLVRTKKETERGIMTISESRSANPKH